jgi:hypothetical protein
MMNKKIKELWAITTAAPIDNYTLGNIRMSSQPSSIERFSELLLTDVLQGLADANINHACCTTYDLGVAESTRQTLMRAVQETYNIKFIAKPAEPAFPVKVTPPLPGRRD